MRYNFFSKATLSSSPEDSLLTGGELFWGSDLWQSFGVIDRGEARSLFDQLARSTALHGCEKRIFSTLLGSGNSKDGEFGLGWFGKPVAVRFALSDGPNSGRPYRLGP